MIHSYVIKIVCALYLHRHVAESMRAHDKFAVAVLNRIGSHRHSTALYRGVVPGGAGGAMAPPDFGRSVNPISTRGEGADYAH